MHGNRRGLFIEREKPEIRLILHVKAERYDQVIMPGTQAASEILIGIAFQGDLKLRLDRLYLTESIRQYLIDILSLKHTD